LADSPGLMPERMLAVMRRHRAICNHCGRVTSWQRDREPAQAGMRAHLLEAHNLAEPMEPRDFEVFEERQCDYCLGPYLDHCTKCARDFCRLHAGDIDGLCGGCI
jgi:hypothetical protein